MSPNSVFDADVLGTDYLPPSPAFPIESLLAPSPAGAPPTTPIDASMPGPVGWMPRGPDVSSPALSVPVMPSAPAAPAPATTPPAPSAGGIDLRQILGLLQPQQASGFNMPAFMSSLGAGLSSAGQNWNKPAMAAFASGAGAAIEGAEKAQQQFVHNQIAAVNAAIHALRAGDLVSYHRALSEYHKAIAAQKRAQARPAPQQAEPPSVAPTVPAPAADPQSTTRLTLPANAEATSSQPATTDVQGVAGHRAALQRALADTGVPPTRLDSADLDHASRLMTSKGLPAAEAFEAASIHNAIDAGHASPAEVDLIYGPGTADAIRTTATS
jgi:hypothetical protein